MNLEVLAEVFLGEHDRVTLAIDWFETLQHLFPISVMANASECASLSLELLNINADKHVSLLTVLLEPSLPLLGF